MANPDIEIRDLVESAGLTEGVFDTLMASVEKHLDEQYRKTRITGPEYANVYLGSLQSVISQSIQYVLGMRTSNAQAQLLEAQALTEAQKLLTEIENTALTTEQKNLILAQIAKTNAETTLIVQKELTEDQETLKRTQEVALVTAQTSLTSAQKLTEDQNALLVTSQRLKTDAEELLIDQKTLSEVQNTLLITAETSKANSEKLRIDAETSLLGQKELTEVQTTLKVAAEADLLGWKAETEHAQTHDTLTDDITAVAGVVAKQKILYERQADGFLRDAEQKIAKILVDSWSVQRSTNASVNVPTELADAALNSVMNVATTAIGA